MAARYCRLLALAGLLLSLSTVRAQQGAKVPDPDPELERKTFKLPDCFEVNLFAGDPLLAKPIQMAFDASGKLWLACSEAYPQIKPGAKQNDKIIVLEDTDGDGKADKTTVFADGLLIPTGIAPGDGGVYVVDSTDLIHLSDTNGDGKADKRRVVLSGFGTEDTHHMVHSLRWGPDGLLYFNQSIYIHSHIETPHGPRRLNAGGIWQFRPETMQLDVFARGWVNSWGHHFDRYGVSFATDGAGGEGINYVVPGGYYATAANAAKILPGLNPGSPKHCGLEIVSGRHLPDAWQGNLITNDFRGNRVCRFIVKEEGAGFVSREQQELIKSNHPAFRPVDVKMGPDGAIYIADWYNPIIQHGEVDFRDPRRDHTHGRIWRVTAKDRPLVKRPKLVDAKVEALLDALKEPEDWTRHFARLTLKERGARAVEPAIAEWVKKLPKDAPEELYLEALWTYQALDKQEPALLKTVLSARDPRIRAAGTRVLAMWQGKIDNSLELLAARVNDDHARVRLEAVRALSMSKSPRAVEIAMQALDRPVDRWLDYSLWLTARETQDGWMPAFREGKQDFGGNIKYLTFALQSVGSSDAVKPLVSLVKEGKVPGDREESVLGLIAALGSPQDLRLIFDLALKDGTPTSRRATLLDGLAQSARQRKAQPSGDLEGLTRLLQGDDVSTQAAALRLAGLWQLKSANKQVVTAATVRSPVLRQAAFDALIAYNDAEPIKALTDVKHEAVVRRAAVIALARVNPKEAAPLAVEIIMSQAKVDPADVVQAFLEHREGITLLATAVDKAKMPGDLAKLGIRAARTSARTATLLVDAFTKAGDLKARSGELSKQELEALVADVGTKGDPTRGEAVFRRKDQLCLKCHGIAGAGGQVGPDLSSIGASAPVDYLVESLLLPNKAVKEGYHASTIEMKNGRVHTGVKVRQTKDEILLRTAEDQEVTILVKDIEAQAQGKSLMPEGLTDNLTRAELVDLVRFLSEMGKGPYLVSKARLVRRWQSLDVTPEGERLLRVNPDAGLADAPWQQWLPAYTTVAGTLPLDGLPGLETGSAKQATVYLRFQMDVTTAGKVKLKLNATDGVTLWLGGTKLDAKKELTLDLKTGVQRITMTVDWKTRKEPLQVEIVDEPGSQAQVRVIGGK